jgi:hypothetical protein
MPTRLFHFLSLFLSFPHSCVHLCVSITIYRLYIAGIDYGSSSARPLLSSSPVPVSLSLPNQTLAHRPRHCQRYLDTPSRVVETPCECRDRRWCLWTLETAAMGLVSARLVSCRVSNPPAPYA